MTPQSLQEEAFFESLIGEVKAGFPSPADDFREKLDLVGLLVRHSASTFFFRIDGVSMVDAGIDDGDLVVVRQQDTADYNQIVVALLEDEATLKRYRPEAGRVVLHAENPDFEDIVVDYCAIQGVAVKVIKDLQQ